MKVAEMPRKQGSCRADSPRSLHSVLMTRRVGGGGGGGDNVAGCRYMYGQSLFILHIITSTNEQTDRSLQQHTVLDSQEGVGLLKL